MEKQKLSELDVYSFLNVKKQELTEKFHHQKEMHQQAMKNADAIRDDLLRTQGAIQQLEQMINEAELAIQPKQ